MASYIIKRLINSLIIVVLVSIFVFSVIHLLPGDPVELALGSEVPLETIQEIRHMKHLDRPLPEQYLVWVQGLFHGDFGESLIQQRTVLSMFQKKLPRTLCIGIPSFLLASVLGIVCGIICVVRRGKLADIILTIFSTLAVGTPQFWVGMLVIYVFSIRMGLVPMKGVVLPSEGILPYIRSILLPVFCAFLHMFASVSRQTRSNMLEVINQDYIRTARANGVPEKTVVFRHALKNALIPVITVIGMQMRNIIGGSVLVETVFSVAGIGTMMTDAINNRDYWVLQSCVLMISLFTVLCNLLVDIVYGYIDPRIREARS